MGKAFNRIKSEQYLREAFREMISDKKNPIAAKGDNQLIYSGVVTFVDMIGVQQPLYSCRVDLDHDPSIPEIMNQKWFEPLTHMTLMRIPQRFERVYVMFANIKNSEGSGGYWFSRSNERTPGPQKVVPVDGSVMETKYFYDSIPYQRGTAAFDSMTPPTNLYSDDLAKQLQGTPINQEGTMPRYYKAVPGDVIQLGGYNTAIRHTYNKNSAKGEIEIISGYGSIPDGENILTTFKNPMDELYSSRIVVATKSPIDVELNQEWGFDFHKNFNLYGPGAGTLDMSPGESLTDADFTSPSVLDSFLLLQTAGYIRLISNDSSEPICHAVMAEPLIKLLTTLIDRVREINAMFLDHAHNHPMGPTIGPPVTMAFAPMDATGGIDSSLETLQKPETFDAIASNYVALN